MDELADKLPPAPKTKSPPPSELKATPYTSSAPNARIVVAPWDVTMAEASVAKLISPPALIVKAPAVVVMLLSVPMSPAECKSIEPALSPCKPSKAEALRMTTSPALWIPRLPKLLPAFSREILPVPVSNVTAPPTATAVPACWTMASLVVANSKVPAFTSSKLKGVVLYTLTSPPCPAAFKGLMAS